jgi:hypothetical protein
MDGSVNLAAEIDALFKLPLAQFTAARNALATRLQKTGQNADADRVKALRKPPVSAWVVNQLYWRSRGPFERLLTSSAELRRAQAGRLAGKPLGVHEPLKAHRDALNELSRQALVFLSQEGHAPHPDVLRRVTLDLQGLAARIGGDGDAASLGRLTADVDAPGFETLAALVPKGTAHPSGRKASRVLSFPPGRHAGAAERPSSSAARDEARRALARAQRAAAKKAVVDAGRALAAARKDAGKAEITMKEAAARLKAAERDRDRAAGLLDKASAKADAARTAARRAAAAAADAAQAVEDAERVLKGVRETLSDEA